MDIDALFTGIAVVIDDEINKKSANITQIVKQIEDKKIPYISYEYIPDVETVRHFEGVSFVLLDWRFNSQSITQDMRIEGVKLPSGAIEADLKRSIEFLKDLKEVAFILVFILTNDDVENVKRHLTENGLYNDDKPNFIFVRSKVQLTESSQLFNAIDVTANA